MRKTLTAVLFIVFTIAVSANASINRFRTDSTLPIKKESKPSTHAKDTLLVSASAEKPILSYQNLIFKQRLDSLQNIVSLPYNEHVQSYIDLYIQRKEQVGKMLGLSKYYFPIFEKALKEIGIPEEIKFITVVESALNPNAVSKSGAVGPWQFMYTTAKGYGLIMDTYVDERKDPVKASYAAAHYLLDAYDRIGDWLLAIAAFNCGTGAVTRAIERSGGVADFWRVRSFLPRETQNYVPAFIATVYTMNYYNKHEIDVRPADFNIFTDVIPVNKRVSLSSIAKATDLDLNELLILNPSYKKQIVNGTDLLPKPLVIPAVGNSIYASLYDLLNGFDTNEALQVLAAGLKVSGGSKPAIPVEHNVKHGQSLRNIADQYGVEVQDLIVWNNLKSSTVVPGQGIKLSPPLKPVPEIQEAGYFNYIVKIGDTLSEIAEKFKGASVSKIKILNGLTQSTLQAGMSLKINKR